MCVFFWKDLYLFSYKTDILKTIYRYNDYMYNKKYDNIKQPNK